MKRHTMKKNTAAVTPDLGSLADDAKALLTATADVAEAKVVEASNRLAAALEKGKDAWEFARDKAVEGAEVTDEAIRGNLYSSIGVAFAVGAVLGFLIGRRE
jgi:ElaB/YqjD/DUF883 family membrane-anchored ribosome-binding protein